MPETVQKGKKKGSYISTPGPRAGMPETMQKGKKKGSYKSRL